MFEINHLIWDEWNIAHIARHGVIPDEVEWVCKGDYVFWETYQQRVMVVGETAVGRLLSIVLIDKSEGNQYPLSARTASRKERRRYMELKGGEQAA